MASGGRPSCRFNPIAPAVLVADVWWLKLLSATNDAGVEQARDCPALVVALAASNEVAGLGLLPYHVHGARFYHSRICREGVVADSINGQMVGRLLFRVISACDTED